MNIWEWLWIGWLGIFLAIEIPASLNKEQHDTFSELWWRFIGRDETGAQATGWTHMRRIGAVCFAAWLVVHLFTGWV